MDCGGNENVCSVRKENNLGSYRIHSVWNKDRFRVNVASKDGAWTGEMTPEMIEKMSKELDIDRERYLAECKEALTKNDGKKGYLYSIENGCFTWKKIIDEDCGIQVRMGSILVQPASFVDTIQNMIDVSLSCNKHLQGQLNILREQKDKLEQRAKKLQIKCEEFNNQKFVMETQLYEKFLVLLNAKKRKIGELEPYPLDTCRIPKVVKNETMNSFNKEQNSFNCYEMDTDDEDNRVEEYTTPGKSDNCGFVPKMLELVHNARVKNNRNDGTGDGKSENPQSRETDMSKKKDKGSANLILGETENLKHSFAISCPITKAGILDFFFGAEDGT